jgi:hypothetical protein
MARCSCSAIAPIVLSLFGKTPSHYCSLQMLGSALSVDHLDSAHGGLPQQRCAALKSRTLVGYKHW